MKAFQLIFVAILFSTATNAWSGTDEYQIGNEWGKHQVTEEVLASEDVIFQRAAYATAYFGSATSFYLGKFNGFHVMATNYHVMKVPNCKNRKAKFPTINKSYACAKVFGLWTDIDLSLFAIKVPESDEHFFDDLGKNFDFDGSIYPGQELLTVGFGTAGNPYQKLVANKDSDCKVFSQPGDFRFMADPDEFNPGPYKAWSFANGCDVSHGDSGSSFVDRKTGAVVGLVWTGRIPKKQSIKDSDYLNEILANQSPEIWTELTYAVPAQKIKEKLDEVLSSEQLDAESARTIEALLSNKTED